MSDIDEVAAGGGTSALAATGSPTLGLAISGGGYRAAAWGIGAVLAITDLEAAGDGADGRPRISMVSSVSGGSITNAQFGVDFDLSTATAADADERAARLAPRLVGERLPFVVGLLALIAIHVVGAIFGGDIIDESFARWAAISAAALVVSSLIGPFARDLLFGWRTTWVFLGLVAGLVHAAVLVFSRHVVAGLAVSGVVVVVLWTRPYMVALAMDRQFKPLFGGKSPKLDDLSGAVAHIICTTDLNTGRHLYLANGYAYNYNWGTSGNTDLRVAAAVQASSNLPVAFNVRALSQAHLKLPGTSKSPKLPRRLPVTDGGVYDNMGSQWYARLPERHADLAAGTAAEQAFAAWITPPDIVVVANASGLGPVTASTGSLTPLIGFIKGLGGVVSVLYEQTTSFRRKTLVKDFDDPTVYPNGTLVHINSYPDKYARKRADAGGSDAARAVHASDTIASLGHNFSGEPRKNADVATAFWPLERERMAKVMWHAYLQTAANLHIKFSTPLRIPPLQEFIDLTNGQTRTIADHWH